MCTVMATQYRTAWNNIEGRAANKRPRHRPVYLQCTGLLSTVEP